MRTLRKGGEGGKSKEKASQKIERKKGEMPSGSAARAVQIENVKNIEPNPSGTMHWEGEVTGEGKKFKTKT